MICTPNEDSDQPGHPPSLIRVKASLSFLHADIEDSDQTERMPRLIWVFAGCTCHFLGFVVGRLKSWRSWRHIQMLWSLVHVSLSGYIYIYIYIYIFFFFIENWSYWLSWGKVVFCFWKRRCDRLSTICNVDDHMRKIVLFVCLFVLGFNGPVKNEVMSSRSVNSGIVPGQV